ncbi:MAG: hypothetical protein HQL86_07015 [Magnetococcales bacterium]|nr:hypothetical protein [Magnetococcales bacterium]
MNAKRIVLGAVASGVVFVNLRNGATLEQLSELLVKMGIHPDGLVEHLAELVRLRCVELNTQGVYKWVGFKDTHRKLPSNQSAASGGVILDMPRR